MKKIILLTSLPFLLVSLLGAKIRVVATYPAIGAMVEQITGPGTEIMVLADGRLDPHTILPRPSLIADLQRADMLIINGAQLEIGWLPPLLSQANNPRIQPGQKGFLDLSRHVTLLDVPTAVSRDQGDVHPDGNPHFLLDPENITLATAAICRSLCQLNPAEAARYRANLADFQERWQQANVQWQKDMESLKNKNVVLYHRLFDYFFRRFSLNIIATIEPLPGIPPSARHLSELVDLIGNSGVSFIVQDVYHSSKAARFLAEKTGVRMVQLPHDIGAVPEARDLFSLFSIIIKRFKP
jgi:zinc/manganese transport system substrate-binding protein